MRAALDAWLKIVLRVRQGRQFVRVDHGLAIDEQFAGVIVCARDDFNVPFVRVPCL